MTTYRPTAHEVPSWVAHKHLVTVFRFPDEDASHVVEDLIREARTGMPGQSWRTARWDFTSHRGRRTWRVSARFAPFVSGSLFNITEVTPS
jgi:hypothetical protein